MMMDCRQIKQLLPLWIGQDLPDVSTASEVTVHLEQCPDCERQRTSLQKSLDVLQGLSAETLSPESSRNSVLSKVMARISTYNLPQPKDRFNGWIPASVMAVAVALMIAVSIPSIHDEFFGSNSNSTTTADLFDYNFESDAPTLGNGPANSHARSRKSAKQTPVVFKPSQF